MKAWLGLWALAATAAHGAELGAPLLLTAGWEAVLEVPKLRAVVSDDPKVVKATEVRDGAVTLLGVGTGATNVWAFTGAPGAPPRVLHYPVVVTRFPTLLPFEHVVPLGVDQHRTLKVTLATKLTLGDATICDLVQRPEGVEVVGRRAGTTTLIAWVQTQPRYLLISVRGGPVTPTVAELDEELTEPTDGRVVLRVGERGVYALPSGVWRLAMKDAAVAAVRPREGGLVFEGLQVGATRVLFWSEQGRYTSQYVVVLPRVLGDPDPVPSPPPDERPEPEAVPVEQSL